MLSRIQSKLGPAGLVVAIVALVAAFTGAAFAANAALSSKQKKEVTKIAKQYAGKPGAPGAPGPAGAPGAKGDKGDKGDAGTNGTNGTNGKSVVVNSEASGANCSAGGVNVAVEGGTKKYVCNGQNGADGGFSEEMESGTTLRGDWSVGQNAPASFYITDSISFLMKYPGATPPTPRFSGEEGEVAGEFEEDCPGSFGEPDAEAGFLCFYPIGVGVGEYEYNKSFTGLATTNFGSSLFLNPKKETVEEKLVTQQVIEFGTWAVTAP